MSRYFPFRREEEVKEKSQSARDKCETITVILYLMYSYDMKFHCNVRIKGDIRERGRVNSLRRSIFNNF